jgi:hypothetical protein
VLFIIREYIEPLGNGERLLIVATFMASLVSAYGVQSHLAGAYVPAVGWIGAATLEIVYLGAALAGTSVRHRSLHQTIGTWLVLIVAAALAIIFNLAHQQEARGAISRFAVAEAVGFPVVALLCALVSHGMAGERIAETQRRSDQVADRERQQADDLYQLQMDYRRQQAEIDLERKRAEHAEEIRALRATLRTQRRDDRIPQQDAEPLRNDATSRNVTQSVAQRVREAWEVDRAFNQSALARNLGVHKSTVNRIVRQLTQEDGNG